MQDKLTDFFLEMGNIGTRQNRNELEYSASQYTMNGWKRLHASQVMAVGTASGILGGPIGLMAVIPDLMACSGISARACYGIGHLKGRDPDYEQDMSLILAHWSGVVETASTVALGKVGIKVVGKAGIAHITGSVAGKVIAKAALKGSSKLASKLAAKAASKAASKLAAKVLAKGGAAAIPIIGGVVSAGVNWWLVDGLMNAAERFYSNDYVIVTDSEVAAAF
jgi:hypothetical protein